ncbi:MAG TPA: NADH-quinone oxidoreductase subunit H, partial [Candidatus Sabulitectum sp.]|nr:NADH-quinone oxidoreductase subunit H [Candidatus Sabulitectum sp.]
MIQSMVHVLLALISAPLLQGVINRVKAFFGGRRGQPLLQPYFDMIRLLRKGAVYGNTTTWIFRISSLAAAAGSFPCSTPSAAPSGMCYGT